MKKQYFSLLVGFVCSLSAVAEEVVVDGLRYDLDTETKDAKVLALEDKEATSVVIPESVSNEGYDYTVTSIGVKAFWDCGTLKSLAMPNTVTTVGKNAFAYCKNLKTLVLSNSLTSISSGCFTNCSGLTTLDIPASVKEIGSCAFMNCTGLTSVLLPEGVTSIGSGAFGYCYKIAYVTIPASMEEIGDEAFAGCVAIKDIYCLGEQAPELGKDVFAETHIDKANLHVPDGAISNYQDVAQWGAFSAVSQLETGVLMVKGADSEGARKYVKNGKIVVLKDARLYGIDGVVVRKG